MLLLFYSLATFAEDWTALSARIAKSVVFVTNRNGSCTGFVIHSDVKTKDDEAKDYILTAAHCEGYDLYADQTPAKIVFKDTKKDLMVLEVDDLERPALRLARENPKPGSDVMSFGYGYGLERAMLRVAHISDDDTYIPEDGIGGPLLVIDASFVSGQSGGPVINQAGEVVMIVQMGNAYVGFGVGAEVIRTKVGRYLEKPKVVKP